MTNTEIEASVNIVKIWMLSLPTPNPLKFTPKVDAAMKTAWAHRDNPISELHLKIVYTFQAILDYRREEAAFSPYYFEKQERLGKRYVEITQRVAEIEVLAAGGN